MNNKLSRVSKILLFLVVFIMIFTLYILCDLLKVPWYIKHGIIVVFVVVEGYIISKTWFKLFR